MLGKTLLTIAAGAAALAFGASSSEAAEIQFGTFATPAGCQAIVGGQEGVVCPNNLTFSGGTAGTLTAIGFSGSPNGGAGTETFLTFKAVPPNAPEEGGLGQNDTGPGNSPMGCSDSPDCEINLSHSVAIQASVPLSQVDVLIGSVQASPAEEFNVWAGNAFGSLVEVATGLSIQTCTPSGNPVECLFNLAAPATIIAIQDANGVDPTSDILVTGVSVVPAPLIGHGLPLLLAGGVLLFGAKLLERGKRRRLQLG